MFIVDLHFSKDNIDINNISSFEEKSFMYKEVHPYITYPSQKTEKQPNGESTHQLRYKHMLEYFVVTQKRIFWMNIYQHGEIIITSSWWKFLKEKSKYKITYRTIPTLSKYICLKQKMRKKQKDLKETQVISVDFCEMEFGEI